jgi:hypothetical protein
MILIPIKDFPDYFVAEDGIYSSRYHHSGNPDSKLRKLKHCSIHNGYPIVLLYNAEGRKTKKVHRLIAQAFIPNPLNLPQVNHINGIKTDFNIQNLEWCTGLQNMKHARNARLCIPCNETPVQQFDLCGNFIAEFKSQIEASKSTKTNKGDLNSCCKGKLKTAGGYKWRYKIKGQVGV